MDHDWIEIGVEGEDTAVTSDTADTATLISSVDSMSAASSDLTIATEITQEICKAITEDIRLNKISSAALTEINGLYYIKNVITPEFETDLIRFAEQFEWTPVAGSRLVQQYKNTTSDKKIPQIYLDLANILDMGHANHVLISKYPPGSGMQPRITSPCFSETLVSVSLASPITIVFKRGKNSYPIYLEPRSAVVLKGDARYLWTHEVHPVDFDIVDGQHVSRKTRYGITFKVFS